MSNIEFQDGSVRPLNVVVGDQVLLPEFGGQKIKLGDEELDLFRDAEFLGKFYSNDQAIYLLSLTLKKINVCFFNPQTYCRTIFGIVYLDFHEKLSHGS